MLLALLLIPIGILIIIYTDPIVNFTGKVDFAENFFLGGGTHTFYKLMGLGITILAFTYLIGGMDFLLNSTVGKVVPGFR